jgi:hypothetical protein
MFREPILMIGEWLYVLMDGVPLMDSPAVLLWVGLGMILMAMAPMTSAYLIARTKRFTTARRITFMIGILSLIMMFPGLLVTVGVPVLQMEALTECRETEGRTGFGENETAVVVKECRDRQELNRFSEFGEWTVRGITPR